MRGSRSAWAGRRSGLAARALGHRALGDELEVVELVGDQLGRRRTGADAQVVAQRALLAFGLVGQARHDALDDALLAACGAFDRVALAGDRHAVQGGEGAGSPDGAARRGGGAGADIETLVGHVRSPSGGKLECS